MYSTPLTFFVCGYLLTLAASVIIGLRNFSLSTLPLRLVVLLLSLTFISELCAQAISRLKIGEKTAVFHCYAAVEMSLVALYFLHYYYRRPDRAIVISIPIVAVAICTANALWLQPLTTNNTNVILLICLMTIVLSLLSLATMMKRDEIIYVFDYPHFYICMALLLLWTSTFFFWALIPYLKQLDKTTLDWVIIAHTGVNIICYGIMGYGLSKARKWQLISENT